MRLQRLLRPLLIALIPDLVSALVGVRFRSRREWSSRPHNHAPAVIPLSMALGDVTVSLTKPLGIILEEKEAGKPGVMVESLTDNGSASSSGMVAPGDILLQVNGEDVSEKVFDDVMSLLGSAPDEVQLTLGDGLGRMDIASNLAKRLSPEDALLADAVVRAAVREVRKNGSLGNLLRVEIVIGAGVQDNGKRCLVRFFAIFSTDGGGTTYSCNVSATGVRKRNDSPTEIVSLSCAKDEGLGQTIDLIIENKQ